MSDITRERFEAFLKDRGEALFWNTSDAMYLAWQASRADFIKELLGMDVEPVACLRANGSFTRRKKTAEAWDALDHEYDSLITTTQAAAMRLQERETLARWIERQRNDIPATGEEFAAAIRNRKD